MLDYGLSQQQVAVICALSNGATITAAAEHAGVHRNTVANWRRNYLHFQQALADAQYDRALLFREKLEDLADLAAKTIRDILADPHAPASVRLKAALAVIQTAATPPLPKKQVELDIEKVVVTPQPTVANPTAGDSATFTGELQSPPAHNTAQTATSPRTQPAAPLSPPVPAASPVPSAATNPAQIRRETPKVGRNEPCPCGSGQKYKRCCLDGPRLQAA